ncbi:transposase [Parachlamydia sp. AcF125]|uniref:transposase n=1 Tax=Parachlamydia sp. AcF125 TaxID=2795736 RepID=UPI001BC8E3E7|nr:transposase [Parachlamydia sp. AcF125]MBS4168553.1 hypothetical protein [Parachlamydia sp. AcF125]
MRERNWQWYNTQLIQRRSLTFLLGPNLLKPAVKRQSTRRRPTEYSNILIESLFMLKIQFKLTYRTLQGSAQSFLTKLLPGNKVPDHTLMGKRVQKLGKTRPKLSHSHSQTATLDPSGVEVVGKGGWKVKVHGRGRLRKW